MAQKINTQKDGIQVLWKTSIEQLFRKNVYNKKRNILHLRNHWLAQQQSIRKGFLGKRRSLNYKNWRQRRRRRLFFMVSSSTMDDCMNYSFHLSLTFPVYLFLYSCIVSFPISVFISYFFLTASKSLIFKFTTNNKGFFLFGNLFLGNLCYFLKILIQCRRRASFRKHRDITDTINQ